MRTFQETAATVEEATQKILKRIELKPYESYEVKVLKEPQRGFLGMTQSGEAQIELAVTDNKLKKAEFLLEELVTRMGFDKPSIESEFDQEENNLTLVVTGEQAGQLIGRRGRRMKALQHLVNLFTNQDREDYLRVKLDIEDYGQYRQKQLERIASYWASRAVRTGRPVKLEPMDVYDRKIIHEFLQEDPEVSTQSEGREPNRALVISPKPGAGGSRPGRSGPPRGPHRGPPRQGGRGYGPPDRQGPPRGHGRRPGGGGYPPRSRDDRPRDDRPRDDRPRDDRPRDDRPREDRPRDDRGYSDRGYGDRGHGDRPDRGYGDRSYGDRGHTDRPDRGYGDRPRGNPPPRSRGGPPRSPGNEGGPSRRGGPGEEAPRGPGRGPGGYPPTRSRM